ncbi:hypothetical protein Misp06_01806 [Microbulbifer sp. NBRC 101763]
MRRTAGVDLSFTGDDNANRLQASVFPKSSNFLSNCLISLRVAQRFMIIEGNTQVLTEANPSPVLACRLVREHITQ